MNDMHATAGVKTGVLDKADTSPSRKEGYPLGTGAHPPLPTHFNMCQALPSSMEENILTNQ